MKTTLLLSLTISVLLKLRWYRLQALDTTGRIVGMVYAGSLF